MKSVEDSSQNGDSQGERIEWSVHLFRISFWRSFAVVIFIVCAAAAGYLLFNGSMMWAAIAVLIIVFSFAKFLFPQTFVFDEEWIEARNWYSVKRRKWSEFRRALPFELGISLVTRAGESRFEFFRSLSVFYGDRKDEVVAFIKRKLAQNEKREDKEA